MTFDSTLTDAIGAYGAWIVGGAVAVESMGIPVPGETMLITAAVFAGTTGQLNVADVVLAAIFGAIAGDNAGFLIGRTVGFRWLVRHRSRLRLTTRRLKLGQYLFLRHGGKVVFFGRFVAILRVLAALLAGLNCMTWGRFLLFNALGAIVWAGAYGLGAYAFGQTLATALNDIGLVLGIIAAAAVVVMLVVARRIERRMEDEAERALPGPLQGPGGCALPVAAESE
ncbi:MAG TPA: DedA family protein [Vicinamibacterales bacterium]|jgi:membrane protein DedA with SNARE-associated domain